MWKYNNVTISIKVPLMQKSKTDSKTESQTWSGHCFSKSDKITCSWLIIFYELAYEVD